MKIIVPVFYLLLFILLGIQNSWAVSVSVRVSSSNDDGEEQNPANNTVYRNSTDLELVYDGGTRQHVGMRFQSLSIPQGATINSAYIEFEVDEVDSGTTNVVIFGQDTDDARTFGNGANNISNRTRTSASVNWSIPAWNSVSAKQQTPDISSLIQEIIDRSGWSSGNDLAIIIEPGSGCNSRNCQRTAESYDGESTNAPLLVVDYTLGGGGTSCETFLDLFSTDTYSRNDGSVNWTGDWVETGDNNAAANGDIEVSGGRLQLEGDGSGGGHTAFGGAPSVEREANLSTYTSATLTFNYSESGSWEGNDDIEIWVSSDGGSNWTLLHTFTNDQAANIHTEDLTAYMSANTRIAFVEKANSGSEIFYFDNVQIEACSSGNPTVDTLSTSDTTPVITGTFNSTNSAGGFTVTVNSVTYTLGTSPQLTNAGDDWTLDLSGVTPLALGFYDVVATSDDGAGNTLSDVTSNELEIIALVCSATFRDNFSSASFGNNDGDTNFSGNWDEFEGSSLTTPETSPDPAAGHVQISGGRLVLQNYSPSESSNAPGVEREMDLSGFTSASFSFDFETTGNVDNDDSLLVRVSSNGGASWTLLENINGIGDLTGSRSYDISSHISANTKISLRFNTAINSGSCCYGANPETISFDNVNIDAVQPCSTVDHYVISHTGLGVTCEAESVTITAHDSSEVPVAPDSSTTITLSTSIVNDGWALQTGNGVFNGTDQYTFDGVETSVQFWLTKTSATTAPHMDIDVSDGSVTDPDDGGVEDPVLEFRDTALRFYADDVHDDIGTQIAGKSSEIAPGNQVLSLRAIQTNTDTQACEARITGASTVQMAFECVNPATCKTNNGVSITDATLGVATAINDNPAGAVSSFSNVDLTFDATGKAEWSMTYLDAGQIALHASLSLPASPPDPAATLNGNTSAFTSKPAGLCISTADIDADCVAGDASCTKFKRTGEAFNLDIKAVAWEVAGESNTDFCSGNITTPNFQVTGVALNRNLIAPAAGNSGNLAVTSFDFTASDNGVQQVTTQSLSEVGVFTINSLDLAYFLEPAAIAASASLNIGRFYPDHFELTNPLLVNRSDESCLATSIFTYMDENFQISYDISARNSDGNITRNYTTSSGFAKLDNTQLNTVALDVNTLTELTSRLTVTAGVIDFVAGEAGVAVDHVDTISFDRLATGAVDGTYETSIGVAPVDSDNVALNVIDLDINNDSINDHRLIDTTFIYYGRLSAANAFGSELVPLSVAIRTEYFDSLTSTFIANTVDNCTSYDAPVDIDLVAATYTLPLASTDLALTGAGTLTAGVATFSLHDNLDPSAGPGVTGDVTYNLVVPAYLKFDWDTSVAGVEDPFAKASFGIYSGDSKQIYFRQIYQ